MTSSVRQAIGRVQFEWPWSSRTFFSAFAGLRLLENPSRFHILLEGEVNSVTGNMTRSGVVSDRVLSYRSSRWAVEFTAADLLPGNVHAADQVTTKVRR